jgi:hypothetical protein
MKILRTATVVAVCLWLVLPSTHVLALCIDSDGSLALEVAVDGACTGSNPRGGSRTPEQEVALAANAVDCCGDCTDVVLSGGGAAIPPHTASAKHKLERQTDMAAEPAAAHGCSQLRATPGTRPGSSASIPGRHPSWDSVVLRL